VSGGQITRNLSAGSVTPLVRVDADLEHYWVALREHSHPDARAGAAVAFLHNMRRPVTAMVVADLAEFDRDIAEHYAGRYNGGVHDRVHALAAGARAAWDLTGYAYGPAHPRRRRRTG
jgi:hypothetical protein